MALTLGLRSGALSGFVSGNLIQCAVGPLKPGSAPPAGKYYIQAPVKDPIYGEVAVMWSGSRGGENKVSPIAHDWIQMPSAVPIAHFGLLPPSAEGSAPRAISFEFQRPTAMSAVFVLSGRPIPGQRCLVVTMGFDALMESLRSEGGAEVSIS